MQAQQGYDDEQQYYGQQQHDEGHMQGQDYHMYSDNNQQHGGYIDDEEDEDDDLIDDENDESSELELPDAEEDLDLSVVYALHTFLATVEGQASVVKGDQLTLLDDSNSYWWLVRVLKTQLVGYIPAENIETPEERLARYYKKQNLMQTKVRDTDVSHGPISARRAVQHFRQPHHPTNRMLEEAKSRPKVQLNPELAGGGRFVDFGPPSFQEYVAHENEDDDEEGDTDASMEEGDEFEDGQGDFEDEEEEDGSSEGSFEGGSLDDDHPHSHLNDRHAQLVAAAHLADTDAARQAIARQIDADRGQLDQQDEDFTQQYYESDGNVVGRSLAAASMQQMGQGQYYQQAQYQQQQQPLQYMQQQAGQQMQIQMQQPHQLQQQQQQQHPAALLSRSAQMQSQAALGVANGGRPGQEIGHAGGELQASAETAAARSASADEQTQFQKKQDSQTARPQHAPGAPEDARQPANAAYTSGLAISKQRSPTGSARLKAFADGPGADGQKGTSDETRKISLTPKIARLDSTESNLSEAGGLSGSTSSHLQPQQRPAGQRNVSGASSNDLADVSTMSSTSSGHTAGSTGRATPTQGAQNDEQSHFRRGSAGSATSSVTSSHSTNSAQKRAASPASADAASASGTSTKKKKSGGILGGLFSRNKKDKKEDKDSSSGIRKGSRRASGSTFDDDRGSATGSPAPESPEREKSAPSAGPAAQQQRRALQQAKDDLFGTEAARRQQQLEAQTVMYQNYGINPRGPGDSTNTSTFSATVSPPDNARHSGFHPPKSQDSPPSQYSSTHGSATSASVPMHGSPSATLGPTGRQLRPGSLIGSPHMTGHAASGDVPVLNVLRMFAGENIVADATFKTVLLNEITSTEDLIKQAMQRFRLDPPVVKEGTAHLSSMEAILREYYLTAKEVDGEETRLEPGQQPLKIFETLSHAAGYLQPGQGLPSVKRSSVGSISSISSTLSMNPAIEKLRMSDFSDDSQVKLYINKRTTSSPSTSKRASDSSTTSTITGRKISDDIHLDANRLSGSSIVDKAAGLSSPMIRFAVKIVINPSDLPDSMVFDPYSHSLMAKSALHEREQQATRSPSMSSLNVPASHREKVLFFPRNANVSEVLEAALDRFGIVEGVVDGGDEVDNKVFKRRSMSRVRYCLAALPPGSGNQEYTMNPSSKILDAYEEPPAYRPYERSSKELRRRSMEAPYNTPSAGDLQNTDPVFILRKAIRPVALASSGSLRTIDEQQDNLRLPKVTASRSDSTLSTTSVYATPTAELPGVAFDRAMSPQQTKQEIIAAQRAASRAAQRAMISAHKNERQGVDVVLADRSTIRSSRDGSSTRYSYIAADGASEIDISEIVENEWRSDSRLDDRDGMATPIPPRDSPSALSHMTAESYTSALTSPLTPATSLPGHGSSRNISERGDPDAEERVVIDRLASARTTTEQPRDYLEQALDSKRSASPASSTRSTGQEKIGERLDRVLAKVRAGNNGSPAGMASALRNQQQHQQPRVGDAPASHTGEVYRSPSSASGRFVPGATARSDSALSSDRGPTYVSQIMRTRSGSATSNTSAGRASPSLHASDRAVPASSRSTPQLEAPPSSGSSTPKPKGHVKQASLASATSDHSSLRSGSPSTQATASAGNATSTPISSTRNDSSLSAPQRLAIPYRDDSGIDFLMTLVNIETGHLRRQKPTKPTILETLTGGSEFPAVRPEIAAVYEPRRQKLDDLDRRLDALLNQVLSPA